MKIYITNTTAIGQRCKDWAIKNLPPETIIEENMENCDIFISIFYNKLVPIDFITARKKCFNFHGGIAPEYRGSGTINWAIINGEKETGITLHEIDAQIDHGPIIDIQKIQILENDTAESIYKKMENTIFEMFQRWFIFLINLNYKTTPQEHNKAKLYTRKNLQEAKDLTRFARAFHFKDKENAFYINSKGEKIYLIY